jgi:acetyltransferase-like isoleucine patch superfamily enzyme
MEERFKNWKKPEFNESGLTKWNWMCQNHHNLTLGNNTDIGAFTYINAKYGVDIEEDAQIGSHCSIYSESTIDDKKGKVVIGKNARIGAHSVVMPGITVGNDAIVAACSFVNKNVPSGAIYGGVPAKALRFANNKIPNGVLLTGVPERAVNL